MTVSVVPRSLTSISALVFVALAFYFLYCQSRERAAISTVAGSLGGWPLNEEYGCTFSRPLSDEELDRLTVQNYLFGRNSVDVCFDGEIDELRLRAARTTLRNCHVFHPDSG